MRRTSGLAASLFLLAGCWTGLRPGLRRQTAVVEVLEPCPSGLDDSCRGKAARSAVSGLVGLYVSPSAAAGSEIERGVLRKAQDYAKRLRRVKEGSSAGRGTLRLRVEVAYEKLGRDLDALGLVRPAGLEGPPKILISLKESGLASSPDVGRAADALRRFLAARGYAALDLGDSLSPGGSKPTGSRDEALAAARRLGAGIVLLGQAAAAFSHERSEGYHAFTGRLSAEVLLAGSGASLGGLEAEASSVDVLAAPAAAKALENVAELAGEKLEAQLAERFRRGAEIAVLVSGPWSLEKAQRLLDGMRRVPGVAGAALAKLEPGRCALRVFVEKLGADELAARLLQGLDGFPLQLRGVEPDFRLVELETAGGEGF